MRKKSEKQFDLIDLERSLQSAFVNFKSNAEEESARSDLFLRIKDLAYAILFVGKEFKKLNNIENISYEYALYLFERIILKKFKAEGTKGKFPWQYYISKNIRHVVYNVRDDFFWKDQVRDMEILIGDDGYFDDLEEIDINTKSENILEDVYREDISKKVIKSLSMFYTEEEIKRLLPYCVDIVLERNTPLYNKDLPSDCQEFASVFTAIVKRLTKPEDRYLNKNNSKLFSSALRSSIFLSTIANSETFPRDLFLCLDIDSLYRLVQVSGGQTIKIPTERDLNSLLGAVVSVSKIITDGKKIKKSVKEAKDEFGLVLSTGFLIEEFISNIVTSLDVHQEDDSTEPIINILIKSLDNIDSIFRVYKDAGLSSKEISQYNYKFKRTIKSLRSTLDSLERRFDNGRDL